MLFEQGVELLDRKGDKLLGEVLHLNGNYIENGVKFIILFLAMDVH